MQKTDTFLVLALFSVLLGVSSNRNQCLVGFYGRGCLYWCSCAGRVPCESVTGTCPSGCQPGWSGTACQTENVAFHKPSQQRSIAGINTADKAVDSLIEQTCAKTAPGSSGWWRVDLQQKYTLYRMSIQTEPGKDLRDVRIYIGDSTDVSSSSLCGTKRVYRNRLDVSCEMPLTGQFVQIVNQDEELVLCDIRIYVCSDYRFGISDCEGVCRCHNANEICDKTFGTCVSGCAPGWTGPGCQTACQGTYGEECRQPCGHCRDGVACDAQTGICAMGCQPGWRGNRCDLACVHGTYGKGCVSCGHCQKGQCESVTGHCSSGCDAGWMGPRCDEMCSEGLHGENCRLRCGSCRRGTQCDRKSGVCPSGCAPGWTGIFCTLECRPGEYGEDCIHSCGDCKHGSCNKIDGSCGKEGCQIGRYGPKCDKECKAGTYGRNCSMQCGNCIDGQPCSVATGSCPRGCDHGWTGTYCKETCKRGFYGEDCEIACGTCVEGKSCHHVTGKCPGECAHGFSGPLCQKKLLMDPTRHLLTSVLLGTGTVVFGTLIAFILCLVVRWRQEKIQDDGDDDEKRTERRTPLIHRLESIQ